MTFIDIIILFIIAAIIGSIARKLVGLERGGCIVSAAVGFIGAIIGTCLGREYNLPEIWSPTIRDMKYPIVWSIMGAVLFTIVLSLIAPRKKK
jgi:uncharacterized membrane protein YeaQ/YmgE (transglycosylase-associated protein family)